MSFITPRASAVSASGAPGRNAILRRSALTAMNRGGSARISAQHGVAKCPWAVTKRFAKKEPLEKRAMALAQWRNGEGERSAGADTEDTSWRQPACTHRFSPDCDRTARYDIDYT